MLHSAELLKCVQWLFHAVPITSSAQDYVVSTINCCIWHLQLRHVFGERYSLLSEHNILMTFHITHQAR